MEAVAGFHSFLWTRSITVTSGGDKNLIGGPHVPEPLLTYILELSARLAKPAWMG